MSRDVELEVEVAEGQGEEEEEVKAEEADRTLPSSTSSSPSTSLSNPNLSSNRPNTIPNTSKPTHITASSMGMEMVFHKMVPMELRKVGMIKMHNGQDMVRDREIGEERTGGLVTGVTAVWTINVALVTL